MSAAEDVTSFLKDEPCECACGCGVVSRPRVKAWRDGLRHGRLCRCRRCLAPTHRRAAAKRERAIAADTGGTRSALSGALNGADVTGPIVDIEETSSEAVVRGIRRWWESRGTQAKVARLLARRSDVPRALVLTWDRRRRVAIMPYDSFVLLCKQRLDEAEGET